MRRKNISVSVPLFSSGCALQANYASTKSALRYSIASRTSTVSSNEVGLYKNYFVLIVNNSRTQNAVMRIRQVFVKISIIIYFFY
nr:MAG TPA: hypothetical protein [Caudoviricetes sp.]